MIITQRPSPHNSMRGSQRPDMIVLHTTAVNTAGSISWILNPVSQVSYHFIIAGNGNITQHVPIDRMAWSNGTTANGDSRCHSRATHPTVQARRANANSYTVSIGFGDMPNLPSEAQIEAAAWLIRHIRDEVERIYGVVIPIQRENIIGHSEISPIRKPFCPGLNFPFDTIIELAGREYTQIEMEVETPVEESPAEEIVETTYTVVAGDTLTRIANQFNSSVRAIASLNNISNPNLIRTGQVLRIPAAGQVVNTAPEPLPIAAGSHVRVREGARSFNGVSLAGFIFPLTWIVLQRNGDRVVINNSTCGRTGIMTPVHINDLISD